MASPDTANSPAAKKTLYYGWVVVAACLAIGIVVFTLRFSFGVFFKSLADEFGLNRAATSGIMSLYMVLCAVMAIIGGWLVDRFGPRKAVAAMGFFTGLSLLLASQAHTLWHMYLSYSLLLAIGTGPSFTTIVSTASRWFVKRRGLAVAVVTSALGFGTIMQPVSAYLVTDFGWRTSYMILAAVGFFVIIPLALSLKLPTTDMVALHESGALIAVMNSAHSRKREGTRDSLLQVVKSSSLWLSFFSWFFTAFCIFVIVAHIVPHAVDMGISATSAAAILSIVGGVSIFTRIMFGRLSDVIGRRKAAIIATIVLAVSMLWLTRVSDLSGLYIFAIIFGAGWGGSNATFAALVADVFGLSRLGVMIGIMDAGFSTGAAIGPALAGYIFDVRGSYSLAFWGGLAAMLVAMVLVFSLRVPTKS